MQKRMFLESRPSEAMPAHSGVCPLSALRLIFGLRFGAKAHIGASANVVNLVN
jgi:hypothetical protein